MFQSCGVEFDPFLSEAYVKTGLPSKGTTASMRELGGNQLARLPNCWVAGFTLRN